MLLFPPNSQVHPRTITKGGNSKAFDLLLLFDSEPTGLELYRERRSMMMGRVKEEAAGCFCILSTLTLLIMLIAAYSFVVPVVVTVDEAALSRLDLLSAPAPAGNGTVPLLAVNLTLAVAVRNRNWAMSAWLTAAPAGELRFRGVLFARGWLAESPDAWRLHRIHARSTVVYRVSSVIAGVAMPGLGSDGVAEFARESAAGVFELELVVTGEIKYQMHLRRKKIWASCPLKLSTATATFARVICTSV